MTGKIIIVLCVVLIMIMLALVLKGTGIRQKIMAVIDKQFVLPSCIVAEMPKIYYRPKSAAPGDYAERQMDRTKYKIGRVGCHLVLDSPAVENVHAVLQRKEKDGIVYYELIDFSKVNPIRYFDEDKNDYKNMGHRYKVRIDKNASFLIGDFKVQIKIPQ